MKYSIVDEETENQSNQTPQIENFSPVQNEKIKLPRFTLEKEPVPEEESWRDWFTRLGAQGGAAVVERIAGAPGDIAKGLGDLAIDLYENTGMGLPEQKEKKDLSKTSFMDIFNNISNPFDVDSKKQREAPKWLKNVFGASEGQQKVYPTSQEARKAFAGATKGYTEPKNKAEEMYRQFVGDFTDLTLVPSQVRMSIPRRAGVALGSELLGESAKYISGKDSDKAKVKAGSMLMFSMLDPGGARRHVSNMYDEVRNNVPQNLTANSMQAVNEMNALEQNLMRSGITTETTRSVLTPLDQLRQTILQNNGQMTVHALMDAKQRVNELRGRFYANTPTAQERGLARQEFRNLMNVIDRSIENGLRGHPEELARFQNANQAWTVLHEASDASRFVSKLIPPAMRSSAMAALFEIASGQPRLAGKLAIGAASTVGLLTGTRLMTQVMNSPTLRKYYFDVTRNALAGNSKAALESWNKLNDAWEIEDHNTNVRKKN